QEGVVSAIPASGPLVSLLSKSLAQRARLCTKPSAELWPWVAPALSGPAAFPLRDAPAARFCRQTSRRSTGTKTLPPPLGPVGSRLRARWYPESGRSRQRPNEGIPTIYRKAVSRRGPAPHRGPASAPRTTRSRWAREVGG